MIFSKSLHKWPIWPILYKVKAEPLYLHTIVQLYFKFYGKIPNQDLWGISLQLFWTVRNSFFHKLFVKGLAKTVVATGSLDDLTENLS